MIRMGRAPTEATLGVDRRGLLGSAALLFVGAGLVSAAPPPASDYDDPDTLYRALREQPAVVLNTGDRAIRVVFADGAPGVDRARTLAWISHSAAALTAYFGQLPVADYGVLVIADDADTVGHATTYGYDGAATRVQVGTRTSDAAFARDWVMVHEMLHTALPNMPRRALWLQEGNATWVEPVARAAAGQLPVSEVWRQAVVGMPRGEPRDGDGGLDGTIDHDRLYWGGATFWLLAEIAILEDSKGRHSLRDAMRAINRASGGIATLWEPEQMMAAGDQATGTGALGRLYAEFAGQAIRTDLDQLFARLGVAVQSGKVSFNNGAPLAVLRRRITDPDSRG